MTPAPPPGASPSTQTPRRAHDGEDWALGVLRWFSTTLPVALVALVMAPFVVAGGSLLPWRPVMPDLGTMIQVATQMVDGRAVFGTASTAHFVYTPFGALLLAPLALSGPTLWQVVLTVASVSALQHLLRRLFGLQGPQLLLAGSLVVVMVEPVRATLGVGQLSLLVMALVVADLTEPRLGGRRGRVLPPGSLTGIAGAIAVSPLWVLLALLLAGRRRMALTGLAAALGCAVLGWIVMPGQSEGWLEGRTAPVVPDALWAANQSLGAALVRFGSPAVVGQVAALLVTIAGAWVAARWWRSEPVLALGLVLVVSVVGRDPAWTWQLVGVVVLTAGLLPGRRRLPGPLLALGGLWVGWAALGVPQLVAFGGPVPTGVEALLGSVGPVLVVLLVVVAALTAPGRRPRRRPAHRDVPRGPTN